MSHWNVMFISYPFQYIQQMTTGLLFILGQGRVVKEHSMAQFHLINQTVNIKKTPKNQTNKKIKTMKISIVL